MDYLFFSSLTRHSSLRVVVSYDIACQWTRNLWQRLNVYGFPFDRSHINFLFLIPKFHLLAHQLYCQARYSFNLMKGVGCTDGEAVERGWATVNPFTSSTKEMGPGHCRDLLDNVFTAYSWHKVVSMGKSVCHSPLLSHLTCFMPYRSDLA